MVRNENDVIESFVRHNLELMDEMHIIDHGSSDGTRGNPDSIERRRFTCIYL